MIVTDVNDIMIGNDWPGAYSRVGRDRLIERWLGRPGELHRRRPELMEEMFDARKRGDVH